MPSSRSQAEALSRGAAQTTNLGQPAPLDTISAPLQSLGMLPLKFGTDSPDNPHLTPYQNGSLIRAIRHGLKNIRH